MANPWDLATAMQDNTSIPSENHSVAPGDTIFLRGGVYHGNTNGDEFVSYLTGSPGSPITVRGYGAEWPIIEATITNVYALRVRGGYTHFRDFEIRNSDANRGNFRGPGIFAQSSYSKFINLVVHDVGVGIYCAEQSTNAEIYGCVLYNNGCEYPGGEGLAHGIYAHSSPPGTSIRENIILNGFGRGIQCFSELGEPLYGFHLEGNVAVDAGILNTNPNYVHLANYTIGGANIAVQGLTFNNNFGYHAAGYADNAQFGFPLASTNTDATICSNYFAGGGMTVGQWKNLTLVSNTFSQLGTWFNYYPCANTNAYLWDTNYYTYCSAWFRTNGGGSGFDLSQWRSTFGFDAHSTQADSVPTNTWVFMRANAYEQGRANIVIYNWTLTNTVWVDVSSVVSPGANYEVRNAQDFLGVPALKGTYNGAPLQLPMAGLTAATPVGVGSPPPPTGPGFNVFILRTKLPLASATDLRISN